MTENHVNLQNCVQYISLIVVCIIRLVNVFSATCFLICNVSTAQCMEMRINPVLCV